MTAKRKKPSTKSQTTHPLTHGVGPWLLVACCVLILAVLGALVYVADESWKRSRQQPVPQKDSGILGDEATRHITVTGKVICLPKIDDGRPQTMECALGVETAEGKRYGVKGMDDIAMHQADDKELTVSGRLQAPEPDTTYDMTGVISVGN